MIYNCTAEDRALVKTGLWEHPEMKTLKLKLNFGLIVDFACKTMHIKSRTQTFFFKCHLNPPGFNVWTV